MPLKFNRGAMEGTDYHFVDYNVNEKGCTVTHQQQHKRQVQIDKLTGEKEEDFQELLIEKEDSSED